MADEEVITVGGGSVWRGAGECCVQGGQEECYWWDRQTSAAARELKTKRNEKKLKTNKVACSEPVTVRMFL
jgi:hypothetical protein